MNLQYQITGEDQQCLQVILRQNEGLMVDNKSLCWFSESIEIENMDSLRSIFLFGQKTDLVCVRNRQAVPGLLGLSRPYNGRVVEISLSGGNVTGIYCFKEFFIASDIDTIIELRTFPQQRMSLLGQWLCCDNLLYRTAPCNSRACVEKDGVNALLQGHR